MTTVTKLQANYLDRVVCLTEPPQFSWAIETPFRNCKQKQYQIQIADEPAFTSPLFDTGWWGAASRSSTNREFVPSEGCMYWARVRAVIVSDGEENVTTPYSNAVTILGGLKNPDSLKDHFITAESEEDNQNLKGYVSEKSNYPG
jgi:hypothetical protein